LCTFNKEGATPSEEKNCQQEQRRSQSLWDFARTNRKKMLAYDARTLFMMSKPLLVWQTFFLMCNIFSAVQTFFLMCEHFSCCANIFPDAQTFHVLYSCNFYIVIICYIIINDMQTLLGFDRLLPDNDYRLAIKIWKAHTLYSYLLCTTQI
jgi:hypothetical protein